MRGLDSPRDIYGPTGGRGGGAVKHIRHNRLSVFKTPPSAEKVEPTFPAELAKKGTLPQAGPDSEVPGWRTFCLCCKTHIQ